MATFWRAFPCSKAELDLGLTLACGQSFRWAKIQGALTGVLAGRVWRLSQTDTHILYQVIGHVDNQPLPSRPGRKKQKRKSNTPIESNNGIVEKKIKSDEKAATKEQPKMMTQAMTSNTKVTKIKTEDGEEITLKTEDGLAEENIEVSILRDYFQLDVKLTDLYEQWCKDDPHFKQVSPNFTGIRMLRQDPVENLFSFICSSNNHISRISGMVERLCEAYSAQLCEVCGVTYYAFPTVSALAGKGVEERLRKLGFGYRARYISETAQYIMKQGGESWLYNLRTLPYEEAKAELIKLSGVGAKVADCVCLMSMDKTGAIPVDTHVWQIVNRDYKHKLGTTKTLTDKTYKEIGDFFRQLWGPYAGWAHSVLFAADLRKFQELKSSPEKKGDIKKSMKKKKSR
ncbi:N-glycosylase/DNA lyase-like [Branchiostoma floridae]|uniref:N-glycosylase/DNA lyase n=1 Tax=Branchiostoma floridae TaxID=7739 RepID=A0A9J7LK99_BRAFL|nr:N-glycosylase/DNA lyase-like [Branchiostoma floridae]